MNRELKFRELSNYVVRTFSYYDQDSRIEHYKLMHKNGYRKIKEFWEESNVFIVTYEKVIIGNRY